MKEKKELILSEDQARRLWERAAQLQAEAAQREKAREGDPDSGGRRRRLLVGVQDETVGYSLAHIKEAGEEVGIQPDFLELALAEEAILELEGGGESGFWDRSFERFLNDRGRTFEIRRRFSLPSRRIWLALEEALTSENHRLDLLEIRGGDPSRGGIAIFESPYAYQKTGSLQYWSSVAEVRRYLVQLSEEEDGGCVVLIRAPLRRSRRVNGVVGMALSGVGGAVSGMAGLALAGLVIGTGGLAAPVVAVGFTAGSVLGGEKLTRMGYIRLYRWGYRALEKAIHRILTRVERDVQREMESGLPPGS